MFLVNIQTYDYFSEALTEVWDLIDENNKVIAPTLPWNTYRSGIGLFPVDFNFCKR